MCHEKSAELRNTTYLELACPINPPNDESSVANGMTPFDFGIFSGAIKSGIMGSNDFPQKLFNCFWWGLRNLRLALITSLAKTIVL